MKEKLLHIIKSKKYIESLLILMVLAFPFGSHLFSFSIGFMTINPFFIFTGLLVFSGLFFVSLIQSPLERYFLIFLCFWLLYSIIQTVFGINISQALIDLRSIILMVFVSFNISWTKYYLGIQRWKQSVLFATKLVYFLILGFALFEYLTGIHFVGDFTQELINNPTGTYVYSPTFLFDNPNNLITNIVLLSTIILLLQKPKFKFWLLLLFVLSVNLFVSIVTDSRFGMMATVIQLGFIAAMYAPKLFTQFSHQNFVTQRFFIIIVLASITVVFVTKDKYYSPKWDKQEPTFTTKKQGVGFIDKVMNYPVTYEELPTLHPDTLTKMYNSKRIRVALFLNGIFLTKKSNYLGVGPGQYRQKHLEKEVTYYSKTNISPHFYFIEIVSQFGVGVASLYVFLFGWVFWIIIRGFKTHYFKSILVMMSIVLFLFCSLMPSSFLILEINWLFVAVLVSYVSILNQKQIPQDEK